MRKTTAEILNDIEELFNTETKESVFKNAIENVPNYPVQLLIDSINAELVRLHMPYTIEDLLPSTDLKTWIVKFDLNPVKLNWNETLYPDSRGEAVYQKLLEPFKDANCIFPHDLQTAVRLFKVDLSDHWEVATFRDWLIGINKSFYPHECKSIMKKLITMASM